MGALLVAAGGVVGTGLRLAVVQLPAGVLLANVSGALLLGLLVAWTDEGSRLRSFAGTGVLGAYTTFSAFAVELALGDPAASVGRAALAVALGLAAAGTGLLLGSVGGRRR
jgi:CrcB protein